MLSHALLLSDSHAKGRQISAFQQGFGVLWGRLRCEALSKLLQKLLHHTWENGF